MNREDLVNTIVSSTQKAGDRIEALGREIFDNDVSSLLTDYTEPSFCHMTAQTVKRRANELAALAAELHAYAGMLEAMSLSSDPAKSRTLRAVRKAGGVS